MTRRPIGPRLAMATFFALVAAAPRVGATPSPQKALLSAPVVDQVTYRHRVHHRRSLQQPETEYGNQVPTGGGDYGGPDTAFPVGENSAVRPGGSYAITAPIGSPAYAIQKEQQRRFCRDNPEVC